MSKSKIEWTESTWSPVSGYNKISRGCDNCYAERMAKRLQAIGYKIFFMVLIKHLGKSQNLLVTAYPIHKNKYRDYKKK